MTKMAKVMPLWGPYSKKYSGISRIVNHKEEKGVRFDLVVSPAVSNTNTCPPNVTIPVGIHPRTAKSDYSHYPYRCDLEWKDVPLWSYFCQISDSTTSYGSYSGAVPNEKITWGKLSKDTPRFIVESDATIVAPLIFAYVLGW